MPATLPKSLLIEKYEKLPLELREAIASVDTANIILATGRAHGLPIDKIGKLAEETGYIMGGVAPAKEFIPALEEVLEISHDQAKAIALEINQKVFLPIREHLKKMHGEKWADEIASGAKPPTAKPAASAPAPVKVPPPAPAPTPRAPEIRPAPQPPPKPEVKETKPEAPVIPPVVKAPPPLPPLAAEPEEGGFVKKPEPLVIGPLGATRREPMEKAFEVKPLPITTPPLAKSPLPPSEVKPAPAAPAVPLAAKVEVSPKEIKPFQPVVMEAKEKLPGEKVAEAEEKKTYEPSSAAKPVFGPPKPLEYIRAKDEVTKELKEFAEAVETKIAAAAKPPTEAEKPVSRTAESVITKEKIIAEIERVRNELAAKKKKTEVLMPAVQAGSVEKPSTAEAPPLPAARELPPPPTPPAAIPPKPPTAETAKPDLSEASKPKEPPSPPAESRYAADPYREPVE